MITKSCAAFRNDWFEIGQIISIPFLFYELIEAWETVFQLRGRSLQCVGQLRLATPINIGIPVGFR